VRGILSISERRACAALGQHRSTQRKIPRGRQDEARLTADIVELVRQYGRYGYRKIAELLRQTGWLVNDKRVERIWRREGLKVPARQPKRARLWLSDGSCIRLRAERPNHVWSYDFLEERTHDGRKLRLLNIIDEFTHECLAIRVSRRLKSIDVIDVLSDLFILRGIPEHIRSDNGPEFLAKAVQEDRRRRGEDRLPSLPAVRGRTALSKASTRACVTNCSMARSSTPCAKRRSLSRVGGVTTIRFARTPRSAIDRLPPRCSCQRSPHGRLRHPDPLRRPCSRWRHVQP
jgi:integrase-like protein/helix-turn-helix protein